MKELESICKRFNSFDLHDCKLLSFRLLRQDRGDNIHFDLEIFSDEQQGKMQEAELIFYDCKIVMMDIDLVGKRMCSDGISSNVCVLNSLLKKQIENEYFTNVRGVLKLSEKDVLAGYLHFSIHLVEPGGDIDIFAKDYELKTKPEPSAS